MGLGWPQYYNPQAPQATDGQVGGPETKAVKQYRVTRKPWGVVLPTDAMNSMI